MNIHLRVCQQAKPKLYLSIHTLGTGIKYNVQFFSSNPHNVKKTIVYYFSSPSSKVYTMPIFKVLNYKRNDLGTWMNC